MTTSLQGLPLVAIPASDAIDPLEVELLWVEVERLLIDTGYQRDVRKTGLAHIARIAGKFSWAKFAPLIVAPAPDGVIGQRFAIIDGQHRAIAAKARGILKLPAILLPLSPADQASAFAAINGNVTPITSLHVFKAARAAGEAWALRIDKVARQAGVTLLTYPKARHSILPSETMAIVALREGVAKFGDAVACAALRAIVAQSKQGAPLLSQHLVKSMIILASEEWQGRGRDGFAAAVAKIDLDAEQRQARVGAINAGITTAAFLLESLRDRMREVK